MATVWLDPLLLVVTFVQKGSGVMFSPPPSLDRVAVKFFVFFFHLLTISAAAAGLWQDLHRLRRCAQKKLQLQTEECNIKSSL